MDENISTSLPQPEAAPVPVQFPQKSNLPTVLLSVLLLATILLSGYLFLRVQSLTKQLTQSQLLVQATPTPTLDPTANWKTYTNSAYGFSFKYPEALILEDRSVPKIVQVLLVAQAFRETKISATKDDLSNLYLDTAPSGKAIMGDLTGNKYFLPQGYCDGPNCTAPILAVSVINNGIKYVFSVFVEKESNDFTELENQILSTFKFTQ